MIEQSFGRFPTIFARLKGKNGVVREYLALIAPTSEYCIIPKVDAFALGYSEAAKLDPGVSSPNRLGFVTSGGYGRDAIVKIVQVDVGPISLKDVEFLTYDVLQATGFDAVLGENLLKNMKLELDFSNHKMKLERVVGK